MTDVFDPYYQWLGIRPKHQPPNHYRLLGIEEFEDNPDVIENAADRQMAHVRLYQTGSHLQQCQEILNEIAAAKLCLLNAAKKAEYDGQLRAFREVEEAPAQPPKPRAVRGERMLRAQPIEAATEATSDELQPQLAARPESQWVAPAIRPTAPRRRPLRKQMMIAGTLLGVLAICAITAVSYLNKPQDDQITGTNSTGSGSKTTLIDPVKPKPDNPVKQKTVDPNPTPETKTNPPEPPDVSEDYVLRLSGRGFVELAETANHRNDAPMTAELWVRVDPARLRTYLMGNIANANPGIPRAGWALSYANEVPGKDGNKVSGLYLQVGGKYFVGLNSEMDDQWHHVALCIEPQGQEVFFRAFLDGKRVLAIGMPTERLSKNPANLCLGCPRYLPSAEISRTDVFLRGFRLSSTVRYAKAFVPDATPRSDAQTVALLDFRGAQGDAVADRSGNGHAGRLVGARWVRSDEDVAPLAQVVDLMQGIVWSRGDASSGDWSLSGGKLLHGSVTSGHAILRLPQRCPREYDLEIEVQRTRGDGALVIGLVYGDRRVALLCDNDNGNEKNTMLHLVTDRDASRTIYNQPLFTNDKPVSLRIIVRRSGITVFADGKSIISWRGDASHLSMAAQWGKRSIGDGLFLGILNAEFHFDKLRLHPGSAGSLPEVPPVDVAALPRYTLRFQDQARVELTGTAKLLASLKNYTVEAWVRPREDNIPQCIVGNMVVGSLHPKLDRDAGWLLISGKFNQERFGFYILQGSQAKGRGSPTPFDGRWYHLAICRTADVQTIYANGRRLSLSKRSPPEPSPTNLCLGVPTYGGSPNRVRFDGDVCGLRVSKGVLYNQSFTPPPRFRREADTLVLLDFSTETKGLISDLSGNGHHGRILKATWIETRLAMTSSPALPKIDEPSTPNDKIRPPDEAAHKQRLADVREMFAEDFAQAKTAKKRLALADKLLKQASDQDLDAATRFVLLQEARELSADNGGLTVAREAVEKTIAEFAIEPWSLWTETLERAAKSAKTNEIRYSIAQLELGKARSAFQAEQYSAAETMLTHAASVAQRALKGPLARRARKWVKEAALSKVMFEQSTEKNRRLATNPDDPEANLAVGEYLCFVRDDWTAGLVHLAKGGEDPLARMARRDAAVPASAKDQETLANVWLSWSKKNTSTVKRQSGWRRASYWYAKAYADSLGLGRSRIARNLEELADKIAAADAIAGRQPWLAGREGLLRTWKAHDRAVINMCISADSTRLVTVRPEEPVKLWRLASGRLQREFRIPRAYYIALTPDGKILATCSSQGGLIALWDTQSGKLLRQLDFADGDRSPQLLDLVLSSDGRYLVACGRRQGSRGFVDVWDMKTNRRVRRLNMFDRGASRVAISPDARIVAVGLPLTGEIHVLDLVTGKRLPGFSGHVRAVRELAISPDGRTLASVSADGAFLWNLTDGKLIQRMSGSQASSVSYSSVQGRILFGGRGGVDLRDGQGRRIKQLLPPSSRTFDYFATQLSSDGRTAVICTTDGEIQLWRLPP